MTLLVYTPFVAKNSFARATGFRSTFSRNVSIILCLDSNFPTLNCFRTVFVPLSFASVQVFSNLWCCCFNLNCNKFFLQPDFIHFNKKDCSPPKSFCKSNEGFSSLTCMSTENGKTDWTLINHFIKKVNLKLLPNSCGTKEHPV